MKIWTLRRKRLKKFADWVWVIEPPLLCAIIFASVALGILVGLMVFHGCESKANAVPGGAAACPPARLPAGIEIKMGGCGVTRATATEALSRVLSARERSDNHTGQPPMNIAPAVESGPPRACDGTAAIGSVSDAGGGLIAANRTGRAAEKQDVPSAASAMRLPRGADAKLAQARLVCLFDAIRQVESGGDDRAVGDGGRSRGPYQCGRAAWADGGGDPADYDRLVWNRAACEKVMLGYWKRYGAVTDEQRARIWNGGPSGWRKDSTVAYWARVKEIMQ